MNDFKTINEIMIPLDKYPHVAEECTLREAIEEMKKCQLVNADGSCSAPRVLLVFNNGGDVTGMTRRRDIMRGLEPKFLSGDAGTFAGGFIDAKVDPDFTELSYDKFITGVRKRADRPVSDVMIPIVGTINGGDHLMKAINSMVDNNTSLLPVMEKGKVIGVLRSLDVMHEIAKLLGLPMGHSKEE
jgi:CBS domain-containing protein